MIPQFIKRRLKSITGIARFLQRLRSSFYARFLYNFRSVGRDVMCNGELKVPFADTTIGHRVFIGYGCYFGVQNIRIGNFVMLAPMVVFTGGDHRYDIVGTPTIDTGLENWRKVQTTQKGISVGDDVWIGYGATIMDGITIGEGSIIGARSVVTKDVRPYSIVAGIPARELGERFSEEERQRHSEALHTLSSTYQ